MVKKRKKGKLHIVDKLQLVFPELAGPKESTDECIVEFIRRSPRYIFPYRIDKEYNTPGDAA